MLAAFCAAGTDTSAGGRPASRPTGDAIAAGAARGFAAAEAKVGPDGYSKQADASPLAWGESYVLMAYLSMFEGTGDAKYLRRFLEHADRILDNRDDHRSVKDQIRNRVMPSWSTGRYSGGKRYAWIVHAGMITYPMARWVYLAKRDQGRRRAYTARIGRYQKAIAETVAAFDDSWRDGPGEGEGHYVSRFLGRGLPLNQQNALGRTLVVMYLATGQVKYRQRAAKLARFFKNRLRKTADKYVWSYWGGKSGAEDISHAAINADFAFVCFRAGIVFNANDMAAFAGTFKGLAKSPGGFAAAVDGTGDQGRYAPQAGRWLHLAFIEPELRRICYEYYKSRWAKLGVPGMIAAAYLVETARPFKPDRPVSSGG